MDKNSASEGFKDEIVNLSLKFLTFIASKTVEVGTSGLIKPFEIYQDAKAIIKPRFEAIRAWNEIDEAFAKVVNTYVGTNGRLVIFIDDLDRCLPENAIQVFEAIKLFLAKKNCIFVLCVDKQSIEDAISLRYKDKLQMSGSKYLEKIIQLPFILPLAQPDNIKNYVKNLVGEAKIHRAENVITLGAGGNPRRIKRFVNTFSLLRAISPRKDLDESVLAKLVMIQLRFPDFYLLLCDNSKAIDQVLELSQGERKLPTFDSEIYKRHLYNSQLIDFLAKTQDIKPRHDNWSPYFYLTEMINISD